MPCTIRICIVVYARSDECMRVKYCVYARKCGHYICAGMRVYVRENAACMRARVWLRLPCASQLNVYVTLLLSLTGSPHGYRGDNAEGPGNPMRGCSSASSCPTHHFFYCSKNDHTLFSSQLSMKTWVQIQGDETLPL